MSEFLSAPDRLRVAATAIRRDEWVRLRAGTFVVRVHALGGPHPSAWNEMRSFGPTTSRFDHHTTPPRHHPTRSVAYLTYGETGFTAAIAEYFQDQGGGVGPIDRTHRRPVITLFELATDLQLLDLDSGWITRAGGNQAIMSGRRRRARDWARAIYAEHRNVEGLAYDSSVWVPGRCIALWDRGVATIPAAPLASRTLDDPAIGVPLARAAIDLATYVV